ncbi:MAG: SAM-dependent DNA methyltransferase [Saprospiraceae bacterium]|nr:MAG: SAM-dependent DNA methyltransferase [Saprospiraceae bacterium]
MEEITHYMEIKKKERNLLFYFLQKKGLDYSKSLFLSSYFDGFEPDSVLFSLLNREKISTLKDVERLLEVMIPESDRKLNGAFFTPSYIVDFIIREMAPGTDDRVIDLSCGCGAFLIGLLDYYKKTTPKTIREILRENVFGADILPYNVERAKALLAIYALQEGEVAEESNLNIRQADSLRTEWQEQFDHVIGNPPYVKFQDLSDENRAFLAGDWRTVKNGTFNLYFAFFELGFRLLKPGGKLGYITPNNYFTSLAGEPLRLFFQQEKCVSRIVDFNHRKVFDVQTYTAITFLKKSKQDVIQFDRIEDGQQPESFLITANGSLNHLAQLNPKKWRLLKSDEQENIRRIEAAGAPIGQVYDICVGIATLKDEVFFVDGASGQGDFYLKEYGGKTFPIEKEATRTVFKISDFKRQQELCGNTRRIIFPYQVKGKSASAIPEPEFSRMFPKCYAYFLTVREVLAQRDKGKTEFSPFYAWGRTQGLTRHGKKLLSPTFSQYPRFLLDEDEDAFFTNGYGLYFRESSLFQHALASVDRIEIAQKVLNSIVMDYYVSKTSVSIEGGYPCYQKNFIEKFALPDFTEQDVAFLRMTNNREEIDAFLIEKYQLTLPSHSFQTAPPI